MEGRFLLDSLCIDRCACFHEHATHFSMPKLCSEVEGRVLLDSLCIDRCACFHEHSTDFNTPR
jgi:hypothetical protein